MTDLLPDLPAITAVIKCPACDHPINDHNTPKDLDCVWTPNDIAYKLVFGGNLSNVPKRVSRQPDGSWSDEKDWA